MSAHAGLEGGEPLHANHAQQTTVPRTPGHGTDGGRRALVIEDDVDSAETLKDVIEMFGYIAAVAHSGQEGIDVARRFDPDIVLCDIGLPGLDGYGVARALRGDTSFAPVLLVALTGHTSADDRRRARDAGFDRHLAKPLDLDALEALLAG